MFERTGFVVLSAGLACEPGAPEIEVLDENGSALPAGIRYDF